LLPVIVLFTFLGVLYHLLGVAEFYLFLLLSDHGILSDQLEASEIGSRFLLRSSLLLFFRLGQSVSQHPPDV
jgi:hypothetical protein